MALNSPNSLETPAGAIAARFGVIPGGKATGRRGGPIHYNKGSIETLELSRAGATAPRSAPLTSSDRNSCLLAGLDPGPGPRHHPLHVLRIGGSGEGIGQSRCIGIDGRVINHIRFKQRL